MDLCHFFLIINIGDKEPSVCHLKEFFMKCISWNVNGIRACVGKGFYDFFNETFFSHKDINVFLKWNYFEDIEPEDENYRDLIEKIISNPDAKKPL